MEWAVTREGRRDLFVPMANGLVANRNALVDVYVEMQTGENSPDKGSKNINASYEVNNTLSYF